MGKLPSPHPVAEGARVRADQSACLRVRFPNSDCDLCAQACPTAALAALDDGLTVQGNCVGCGQCQTVCPTSTLLVDGFAPPRDLPAGTEAIAIDCWRVPRAEQERGTIGVPCLGGISAGWLLELVDRAGGRPIRLQDRGGCASCPGGDGIGAARATLAETHTHLTACGLPAGAHPRLITGPGIAAWPPSIPALADARALGRRTFFRDLVGGVARTLQDADNDAPGPLTLRHTVLPVERLRVVTALARIAARHGRDIPAAALPQLSLSPCQAHGICSGVCPTGALHRVDADGDATELRFLSALCVACGQCAGACPDRAIRVAPAGGQAPVEILARWDSHECESCGRSFFGSHGGLCSRCSKENLLSRDMAALFQPSV